MKAFLFTLILAAGFSTQAIAGELDNDGSVANKTLQGTLVIRLDKRTNQAAAVQTGSVMTSVDQAKNLAQSAEFKTLGNDKVRTELDQDGGASSWYFYCGAGGYYNNYYNYGYVNWYGAWYNPYYTYNYGYYSYYYYGYGYGYNYWR